MLIVKVPGINGLGKTRGCEKAGDKILEEFKEIYINERGIEIDTRKLELEEIHVDNSNVLEANKLIYKNAREIFEEKSKTIFLGGDHSISYSLTLAFFDNCKSFNKESCLIIFDAHPDLMPPLDGKIPTHEEWLRALIENGFPEENILLVGIRNSDVEELRFISEKKIKVISMNQLLNDLEETCDFIMEFSNGKELYLSLDIDAVDPVFAPATGYTEVGGLTSREFIYLVQRLSKVKNLRAVDIVEINPEKDKNFNNITIKLGAKVLSELFNNKNA